MIGEADRQVVSVGDGAAIAGGDVEGHRIAFSHMAIVGVVIHINSEVGGSDGRCWAGDVDGGGVAKPNPIGGDGQRGVVAASCVGVDDYRDIESAGSQRRDIKRNAILIGWNSDIARSPVLIAGWYHPTLTSVCQLNGVGGSEGCASGGMDGEGYILACYDISIVLRSVANADDRVVVYNSGGGGASASQCCASAVDDGGGDDAIGCVKIVLQNRHSDGCVHCPLGEGDGHHDRLASHNGRSKCSGMWIGIVIIGNNNIASVGEVATATSSMGDIDTHTETRMGGIVIRPATSRGDYECQWQSIALTDLAILEGVGCSDDEFGVGGGRGRSSASNHIEGEGVGVEFTDADGVDFLSAKPIGGAIAVLGRSSPPSVVGHCPYRQSRPLSCRAGYIHGEIGVAIASFDWDATGVSTSHNPLRAKRHQHIGIMGKETTTIQGKIHPPPSRHLTLAGGQTGRRRNPLSPNPYLRVIIHHLNLGYGCAVSSQQSGGSIHQLDFDCAIGPIHPIVKGSDCPRDLTLPSRNADAVVNAGGVAGGDLGEWEAGRPAIGGDVNASDTHPAIIYNANPWGIFGIQRATISGGDDKWDSVSLNRIVGGVGGGETDIEGWRGVASNHDHWAAWGSVGGEAIGGQHFVQPRITHQLNREAASVKPGSVGGDAEVGVGVACFQSDIAGGAACHHIAAIHIAELDNVVDPGWAVGGHREIDSIASHNRPAFLGFPLDSDFGVVVSDYDRGGDWGVATALHRDADIAGGLVGSVGGHQHACRETAFTRRDRIDKIDCPVGCWRNSDSLPANINTGEFNPASIGDLDRHIIVIRERCPVRHTDGEAEGGGGSAIALIDALVIIIEYQLQFWRCSINKGTRLTPL